MTNAPKGQSLADISSTGKGALAFAKGTIVSYVKLSIRLHQTACLAFYRAAQFGDVDALNAFYAGLRVNDQTALRVWIGKHSSFMDLANSSQRMWLKFSAKEGFAIVNGVEVYRKDMFSIDESVPDGDTRTVLLNLAPFYDKNVKDKDALTIEELITMLARAAKNVSKRAEGDHVDLPASIVKLVKEIETDTAIELGNLARKAAAVAE